MSYADVLTTYSTYGGLLAGTTSYADLVPPAPPTAANWKAGGFMFPTSTGSFSVTGLGFKPQAVLFIGSNQSTEDTVVTGSNLGVFYGLAALDWDSTSIISISESILPNVIQRTRTQNGPSFGGPITMMTSAGPTQDYAAQITSFDTDGFTLNVTDAASADRPIHYLAWGGFDHFGAGERHGTNTTLSLGWRVRSLLTAGVGNIPAANNGNGTTTGATGTNWLTFGGAVYPTDDDDTWESSFVSTIAAPSGQRNNEREGGSNESIFGVGMLGHAVGPFLDLDRAFANPTGTGNNSLSIPGTQDGWFTTVFWDGDGTAGGFTPETSAPDQEPVPFTNPEVDEAAAVLFLGISNEQVGGAPAGAEPAVMFGFATADYQACVIVDNDGSLFQSGQRSWASSVDPTGVHAGTVEFVNEGFVATTEDDTAAPSQVAYLAWGRPLRPAWIPHIYRRILSM